MVALIGGPAVKALKRFYIHAPAFVFVNIALFTTSVLLAVSVFASELWWLHWPLFGWGIGLEALVVFGSGGGARSRVEREIGRDDGRGERMDFQVWKQRREELVREAEQNRLAKAIRDSRKRRGAGRVSALAWELKRIAGRFVKHFRTSRKVG